MEETVGRRRSAFARVAVGVGVFVTLAGCASPGGRGGAGTGTRGAWQREPSSAAATADPRRDCLERARALFHLAADGDRSALRECSEVLAACDGDAAKVLAYRGGCAMLEAARAPLPWDKGAHARRGLAMLDEAVAAAPVDLEVRFVRGMTSYHLPRFLGRTRVAAEDLSAVAGRAEAAAESGDLDRSQAAAALFHHGALLASLGDQPAARSAWRRAAALGPATRAGRAAADRLRSGD
jgi:hypothetical protein